MIIPVNLGQDSYDITLERGALKYAAKALGLENEGRKVMIVTDDGVPPQYANKLLEQCRSGCIHLIPQGEASKNFDILQDILSHMLIEGFTRKDCVAAVGGGVVGDLAGFAAACYMRGIDFYQYTDDAASLRWTLRWAERQQLTLKKSKISSGPFTSPKVC